MQDRIYELDIFPCQYIVAKDRQDVIDIFKYFNELFGAQENHTLENTDGVVFHLGKQNNKSTYIVFIDIEKDSISLISKIGLIAHEATHVVQFILEDIGEDNAGREIEAYLIQKIVQNIIDELGILEN